MPTTRRFGYAPLRTIKVYEQKYSRRVFLRDIVDVDWTALEGMGRADLKPSSLEFVDVDHPMYDAVESHVSAVLNLFPAYGEHVALTPEEGSTARARSWPRNWSASSPTTPPPERSWRWWRGTRTRANQGKA